MKLHGRMAVIASLILCPPSVWADIISFHYTGTITQGHQNEWGLGGLTSSTPLLGKTVEGRLDIESSLLSIYGSGIGPMAAGATTDAPSAPPALQAFSVEGVAWPSPTGTRNNAALLRRDTTSFLASGTARAPQSDWFYVDAWLVAEGLPYVPNVLPGDFAFDWHAAGVTAWGFYQYDRRHADSTESRWIGVFTIDTMDVTFAPAMIPEPGTYALMLVGIAGVAAAARRRRAAA